MAKTLLVVMCLLAGAVTGFLVARGLPPRSGLVQIRNFDARPTMPDWVSTSRSGPIHSSGSQELTLISGKVHVGVFQIREGRKELLHELDLDSDWFHALHFTLVPFESSHTGLVMAARTILKSAGQSAIKASDHGEPSPFEREWRVDLGEMASVMAYGNELATSKPDWRPDQDTIVICYQYSRTKEDGQRHFMKGSVLDGQISEPAMLEASRANADLGFVLVTARVLK